MNINYEQSNGFNTGAEHSRLQHQRDRRRQLHHARALVFVKLRQIPHACVGSSLCTVHVLRLCTFDYDYTYDSTRLSDCIEQSGPTMQHRFSDQIECSYDNDLSISNLPKVDQWHKDDRLLCCNDCHIERCYNNHNRCHDDRLESMRAG